MTLAAADTVCPQCVPTPAATIDMPGSVPQATVSLPGVETANQRLPNRISRYEIREKIGERAFGIVYRAFDPQLNREIALKVAKPAQLSTPERVERFLREARAAANLRHPNIELQCEEAERRSEYLTRIARFDAFWHDHMAHEAETINDHFAAEFHLRLLVEHAPNHLGWHERRAKALQSLNRPVEAFAETKIAERLEQSPPELIAAPHLEPLPPPGPRAKIKLFKPLPPNFDE